MSEALQLSLLDAGQVDALVHAGAEVPAPRDAAERALDRELAKQHRLARIEVLNWGTFGGDLVHALDVPRGGLVITGRSGSGKSSLLDAVSTVLVPRGRLRFNAAAQDTERRGSDRSLYSYIRGAYKRGESDAEIGAEYLRPGATRSALLLRFDTADGQPPVTLVKLFHLSASGSSNGDIKEVGILLREDAHITDFAEYTRTGIDIRALRKAYGKSAVLEKHSAFVARVLRPLGLHRDEAVELWHRTMAAKNFASLDGLFREFMLERPKTFAIAEAAVAQFSALSEAHGSVVEARRQLEVLEALQTLAQDWEAAGAELTRLESLRAALDPITEVVRAELAADHLAEVTRKLNDRREERVAADRDETRLQEERDTAHAQMQDLGGARIEVLTGRIEALRAQADTAGRQWALLARHAAAAGIEFFPTSEGEYEELKAGLLDDAALAADRDARRERANEAAATRRDLREQRAGLQRELDVARASSSNLGSRLIAARELIAEQSGLEPVDLPFAAELMEVRAQEREWTGAVERVLRPLALTLLTGPERASAVRRAMDANHLGARIELQVVSAGRAAPGAVADPDSLVHKIELKADERYRGWLAATLAERYDFSCVADADALDAVDRGVTAAGQVKFGGDRFVKDDRYRIDDAARWLLGFSADDKVVRLGAELARIDKELAAAEARYTDLVALEGEVVKRLNFADEIRQTDWEHIDAAGIEETMAGLQDSLATLGRENPELAQAQARETELTARLAQARALARDLEVGVETLVRRQGELKRTLQRARDRAQVAGELPAEEAQEARGLLFAQKRRLEVDELDARAKQVADELFARSATAQQAKGSAETGFAQGATSFQKQWPAALPEAGAEVADRAVFAALRAQLVTDNLPVFEARFKEMLAEQSMKQIGQLRNQITRAPGEIRKRIEPVNESLAGSQFDTDRYLRIEPREVRSTEVKTFIGDLGKIAGGYGEQLDGPAAEEKFALMERVIARLGDAENRRWRDAVLDTRRHVTFVAIESDGAGNRTDIYESSAGLSGGQRQKLVIFCLAAALRYQLADQSSGIPTFGTVVLDEAFDKTDASFTRIAIEVFLDFGFHLLLATPEKLLPTLELYVEGLAQVTSSDRSSSRVVPVMWRAEPTEAAESEEPVDPA
ncbi:hypothetical protein NQ036_07515 [Brevibacterium sp. 91QC2O2]|uniref:ATP-binding protein n=1 Tax=Brevibacterium sp. 91QC2O2 TaxID=2968458 RepID=UPI00211D0629|nr:SbcC/MukB-like Walker B domain-containing protein [Brevibacterium sp. 91QC2O2]MCQ9368092.1 hypothetical protein [Brevibacterium sp. 91QC2O2]